MGFKRTLLNRLQILDDKKTNLPVMDGNDGDPSRNDGNRKHTDFSIDKILSETAPTICTSNTENIYSMTERYAYWNRNIFPMIGPATVRSTTSTTTTTSQYEVMNLSLRMYDQPFNGDVRDRLRNTCTSNSVHSAKFYGPQLSFNNLNSFNLNREMYSLCENFNLADIDLMSNKHSVPLNSAVQKTELETENEITNLACTVCNKVFENSLILENHERAHKSPRYKCDECGKGFSQLRNYKYHVSVHKGTKEFAAKCPECDKLFNDKGYLSSHLKIHRNKKEYVCPHCPKSFNQRVAFNMHVRIHSGVKPHKCAECGKCFSRKMLLKQHLRTHSGEKPYQCSVCLKTFADRSNMTLHQRLHSGIKPFACTICPKAFTKKHHLKTHLNYHIGCKPYVCPHENCKKSFTQSSNMRTHSRKCEFKPRE